jgi:hypothetical protein
LEGDLIWAGRRWKRFRIYWNIIAASTWNVNPSVTRRTK